MVGVLNTNKKGFRGAVGAGVAGLGATLGALVMTGQLFAAFPLTGIGGFIISAPQILGSNFNMAPSFTQTDQAQGWPAALITLDTVNMQQGFELTKHFDLSATPLAAAGIVGADLNVLASTLSGTGVQMASTGLQSQTASFGGFDVHEGYDKVGASGSLATVGATNGTVNGSVANVEGIPNTLASGSTNPQAQLSLHADNITLASAAINADALKTAGLNMSQLKLEVIADSANGPIGGNFGYSTGFENQSVNVQNPTP
jgi:hypothetical protein